MPVPKQHKVRINVVAIALSTPIVLIAGVCWYLGVFPEYDFRNIARSINIDDVEKITITVRYPFQSADIEITDNVTKNQIINGIKSAVLVKQRWKERLKKDGWISLGGQESVPHHIHTWILLKSTRNGNIKIGYPTYEPAGFLVVYPTFYYPEKGAFHSPQLAAIIDGFSPRFKDVQ